jgi:hypothetical protein
VANNFQTAKKEVELLTEYESVTQRAVLFLDSILSHAKQLQHLRLS